MDIMDRREAEEMRDKTTKITGTGAAPTGSAYGAAWMVLVDDVSSMDADKAGLIASLLNGNPNELAACIDSAMDNAADIDVTQRDYARAIACDLLGLDAVNVEWDAPAQ